MKQKIGDRIAELREAEQLTQKQLADMISAKQQSIQRIEANKHSVYFDKLEELVNVMGYNIEFIKKK